MRGCQGLGPVEVPGVDRVVRQRPELGDAWSGKSRERAWAISSLIVSSRLARDEGEERGGHYVSPGNPPETHHRDDEAAHHGIEDDCLSGPVQGAVPLDGDPWLLLTGAWFLDLDERSGPPGEEQVPHVIRGSW